MKNDRSSDLASESNAAAQAASRGVLTAYLQRNAIVTLGIALIRPILGLFRRRPVTQIERLRLERYSSRPVSRPPSRHRKDPRANDEGDPGEDRSPPEAHPNSTRSAFRVHPKNTRSAACPRFARGTLTEGGYRHG